MNILTLHCPDQPGIVARVAACLHDNGCNIEESAQFHDVMSGHFFMRVVLSESRANGFDDFRSCFQKTAPDFNMVWQIYGQAVPVQSVVMVSKDDHCLIDLLYRARTGHLNTDITAIVSNHENCRDLAEHYGVPFHYLPITKNNKAEQETALENIIKDSDAELLVLARYMQILSEGFCAHHSGRMINIHHSFLPGFKGAKPYHQAYERGVKIIGATAHFVTSDLDEGPIIEQETLRISHADTPQKLQLKGRDIEARVLSAAVAQYTERRVFLHNGRTIIL